MKKKILLGVLVGFSAMAAFAESESKVQQSMINSEGHHQADAKTFELTPGVGYDSTKVTLLAPNANVDRSAKTYLFALGAEYGLTENFSLGAKFEYDSEKTTVAVPGTSTSYSAKGMTDPEVYFNVRTEAGPGVLLGKLTLSKSLEHKKSDLNSGQATNEASGGMDLIPTIAYDLKAGPGIFGVDVSYAASLSDRKTDYSPGTYTISSSGGETLGFTLFYEYLLDKTTLGITGGYATTSATTDKINDGTTTTTVVNKDKMTTTMVALYAGIPLSETIDLIPRLGYAMAKQPDSKSLDSINILSGTLDARFKF